MNDDEFEFQQLSMLESAIALHELFSSYVRAGFTRAEALEIVLTLTVSFEHKPNNE
jgi:hypothetical protein